MGHINQLLLIQSCLWYSSYCFAAPPYPTTPPNPLAQEVSGQGIWSYDVKDSNGKVVKKMKLFLFGPMSYTQNIDNSSKIKTYTINFPITPTSEDQYKYIVGSQLIDVLTNEIICSDSVNHSNNEVLSSSEFNKTTIYSWEYHSAGNSNIFSVWKGSQYYMFYYNLNDTIGPYIGSSKNYLAPCLSGLNRDLGQPSFPVFTRERE